ncbi:MAG: UvrD-helicase domain-containing protein [Holosporaceae bacterium]|jgi:ATP-dependent helicase/nuclease subunit A|nr:UvrD-helicase domain-containing protein [Holosporaceae bacterium]
MENIKDTSASLWISASAGTGKTKSLVDRILALLLNGANPSKILCLTYTKAAASEMLTRLSDYLKKLNKMSDSELKAALSTFGTDKSSLKRARSLYEKSMEKDWISIQTIHSFCLELLKQFPLETGLFPGLKICDDIKLEELLNESINYMMENEECLSHWKTISKYAADISQTIKKNAMALRRFTNKYDNFQELYADFFDLDVNWINLDDEKINDLLLNQFFHGNYRKIFADYAKILFGGNVSDITKAQILQENSICPTEKIIEVFLTQEGTVRKSLCTQKIRETSDLEQQMQIAASKILNFWDIKKRIASAKANTSFFETAKRIISRLQELKMSHHYLDFNDVILLTLELLENIDWVMYKTDVGMDHLLVDEAQDTSPEQWEVIKKITDEFFSNYQSDKTIFVVGDRKQAIYSFQGTDVELFDRAHDYFKNIVSECGQRFHDEPLTKSYRTTGNILSFVDDVFSEKFPNTSHSTHRNPNTGVVEIVDIFEDEASPGGNPLYAQSAKDKLSRYIANFIQRTIAQKVWVESRERTARAEDFLILFRHRDRETMERIVDALKREHIPVAGIDKIILNDELIVNDLIALAEFSIFPLDDLMCARVLKSPIIGISEETLMKICLDRKDDNLWNYIQRTEYFPQKLLNYVNCAFKLSVFDFFMYVLTDGVREKFIDRLGEKCLDILNEFLEMVMNYEKDNNPSLQSFLEWFRSLNHEVKREPVIAGNAVRLMTVHGSKGLQSPFVILADCDFINNQNDKLIKTENEILLWDFFSATRPNKIAQLLEKQQDDEYYRLLYVAMTRAEDFLYILGKKSKTSPSEKSWYGFVRQKIDKFVRVESEGLYRLGSYRIDKSDRTSADIIISRPFEAPFWLHEKIPLTDDISPGERTESPQIIYGDCVHKLLSEIPPYLKRRGRDEIADHMIKKFDLSTVEKAEAKKEALEVIKTFPFLFDSNSLSEVSFVHDGKEGRIDKIAFLDHEIWIVDFKTGAPRDAVSGKYARQLAFYLTAVFKITQNSNIRTAILWTKNKNLMEINQL